MPRFTRFVLALCGVPLLLTAVPAAAAEAAVAEQPPPVAWESWHAGNDVSDSASLQRGARNFMNYCQGCHALKYMRYQRMADDLKIPTAVLNADLVAPGSNNLDYISTPMPSADALNWFGKVPPDLSVIARARGVDYLYQYLKTFYSDPSTPTLSNNPRALPLWRCRRFLIGSGGRQAGRCTVTLRGPPARTRRSSIISRPPRPAT